MKYFILLLSCFVAVVVSDRHEEFIEKINVFKADCLKESNAKPDLVEKLLDEGEFDGDHNVKCFMKCVLVKSELMKANGEILEEGLRSQLPSGIDKGKVETYVKKCKEIKEDDDCETALKLIKCTYEFFKEN